MPQFSNKDKAERGANAKKSLENILNECLKYSYIKEIVSDFHCGYENFDSKQFYSNFIVTFHDGTKWILYTTTSCRSDRIKGNQWDSYNIKIIDKSVKNSILIYPDFVPKSELDLFQAYNLKIQNKVPYSEISNTNNKLYYSAIDHVISQSEFFEMIQNYANINLSNGQKKDKEGNVFESFIAAILSDKDNFYKWKNDKQNLIGTNFKFYKKILDKLGIDRNSVWSITATSDKKVIGVLESNGNPKTDVLIRAFGSGKNEEVNYTISCKKTNAKSVSVHQYSAKDFLEVLDKNNSNLRKLLFEFQEVGNLRDFGEEKCNSLTYELKPYLEKLIRWVIGGYGGKNRTTIQCADYILIHDENDIYIHTLDEYVKLLLQPNNQKHFGTPFQWTYASGRKGKDIQLKCTIIK
ncbi:MAG: MspI family type II restriction endonuclease [Treponema sp.]|nr:MspI family type II restriction endonuclease [Treponema sp.]